MFFRYHQKGFVLQLFLVLVGGIFLAVIGIRALILPPKDFPQKVTFEIKEGDSLGVVAYRLSEENIIASPEAFKLFMLALGTEKDLAVGSYYFEVPITMVEVALKISGNEFGVMQHRVTFPEGFTNTDIADRLQRTIEGFDREQFLLLAKDKQGYLFPDTYGLDPSMTPAEIVQLLEDTFYKKTAPLESMFSASARSKKDIIVMASILEKEANKGEEAHIVSGILWKRISLGIPLQVDAPFLFLLGKTSAQLTVKDLAIDSPYNTYRYKGLPPTPINNPGVDAITAALQPKESPYLYYLHDAEGTIYYARTYQEHLANKKKYLQ